MSEVHLERVRRICLALPEATEKPAWGEPTFRVRNRLFAMYAGAHNHHGGGRAALWCHAPPGAQQALVEAAPDRFFVPPYVGPRGWVGVWLDEVHDEALEVHVAHAYAVVAPEKLRARLRGNTDGRAV